MKPFEEQDRYNYDLQADSLVIDGGAFEGNWANIITQRYRCDVICYEPTKDFFRNILARLAAGAIPTTVIPIHAGLGGSTRTEKFGIKGDQTGIACIGNTFEEVRIVDVADVVRGWMKDYDRPCVDLLKLNIEGMEYEVLERLIDAELLTKIHHLQVQFHRVMPDHEQRHTALRALISLTHELQYDEPFIWTGWSLRR